MKILLLGLPALKPAFQELGHDVLHCAMEGPGDISVAEVPISIERLLERLPDGWYPEFVLLTDESVHPLVLGLERLDVPVGWYAIDSHIHYQWHQAYASVFDCVFVAQRDYLPFYVRDAARQHVQWMPLFCPTPPVERTAGPKYHNLSFVGSLNPNANPDRCRFLEDLQAVYPINVATGAYHAVFAESYMVLNQCVANDVNFRTYEAMASGSLLLMERVGNGLTDLFQDHTHCVMYEKGNVDDVVTLAAYYSAHEREREAIAARGREEVLNKHMARHRAQSIVDTLAGVNHEVMVRRRHAQQGEILYLLMAVYDYVAHFYDRVRMSACSDSILSRKRMAVAEKFRLVSEQINEELGV